MMASNHPHILFLLWKTVFYAWYLRLITDDVLGRDSTQMPRQESDVSLDHLPHGDIFPVVPVERFDNIAISIAKFLVSFLVLLGDETMRG